MLDNTYKCYDGVLKVSKDSMTIMKGIRSNGLHTLQASTVVRAATLVIDSNLSKAQLWNRRLGHVSERGLMEQQKQDLLCGDKQDKLEFCENFIHGKATRVKFQSSTFITKETLSYIHSDCGGHLSLNQ